MGKLLSFEYSFWDSSVYQNANIQAAVKWESLKCRDMDLDYTKSRRHVRDTTEEKANPN